jgi:hypothetical protein
VSAYELDAGLGHIRVELGANLGLADGMQVQFRIAQRNNEPCVAVRDLALGREVAGQRRQRTAACCPEGS